MVSSEMAENSPSPNHEAPTPQCVGREFVRQYYTLLAEAPRFVHRFYSNESIFVHGSDEEIVGQNAIEKKIAALGYQDCRTRIRVLDSHETIGKGVVVQVVGEITVNGDMSAMRRFVQTFVLAPQSEKKYYVYNDIFRYEDDLFKETDGKDKDGENDSGTVPDPPTVRPLEQRPPRGISNGGTADLDTYYTMLPGQPPHPHPTPAFQASVTNEQGIQPQLSPSTQPNTGYGTQAPLPQRTAPTAAPEAPPTTYGTPDATGVPWSGNSVQLPQSTSSVAPAPTGPAADAQQHYAQPSQQQQPTAASFNAAMPSQSPVPSSNVAPHGPATGPSTLDQQRPLSVGKESPDLAEDQDQQSRDATAPRQTWATLVKSKTQPPTSMPTSGPPPMVSPGQNIQQLPRPPPMDAPIPGGQQPRWSGPQANYQQQNYQQPWEMQQQQQQQYPRQYRPTHPDYPPSGQSQDSRASPAPSGGGGGGRGRDIPVDEGVYMKNVPMTATDDDLRKALSDAGYNAREIRMMKKDSYGFAFVHLESTDAVERLIQSQSLKLDGGTILVQPLRRDAYSQGGRSAPGTGPGSAYPYSSGVGRGGRGGRGSVAPRGGDRGGRGGGRGGGGAGGGSRMFMAGGGNRGGGTFQNN